jgi:hypothetical protein
MYLNFNSPPVDSDLTLPLTVQIIPLSSTI